jgi:hypothetical protein
VQAAVRRWLCRSGAPGFLLLNPCGLSFWCDCLLPTDHVDVPVASCRCDESCVVAIRSGVAAAVQAPHA